MPGVRHFLKLAPAALAGALICASSHGQGPLMIYTDAITNSFQDWSWASHNLANTTPVHSGARSVSVSANAWEGISFYHSSFSVAPFANFSFWAHGGATGGQKLRVYAEYGPNTAPYYDLPGSLTANGWQQFNIPLSTLGIAGRLDFNRITIQLRGDGTSGTFYLDDIQFGSQPLPALVNVSVSATQALRTADLRHFGVNLAMWDTNYDVPYYTNTIALMQEMGCLTTRMPGGSLSDEYHWAPNTTLNNTWQWAASFGDMIHVTTNAGIRQAIITVNYGTGTPQEAAAWVRHANVTNHLGYKYWEIGNECYGTWETDSNTYPHDPYTYAVRASNYIAQMKLADPTIKVGVVAVPGETSNDNGYTNHPALNSRTGQTRYGWTPVLLTTLKSMGVTPDFLVHHFYAEWTDPNNPANSSDNDFFLLLTSGNWADDAADLRQQVGDYFGSGGTNIELLVTENNSDSGNQGRQSSSIVNALYYADSLGQLLKTEFNSFVWWDFRNGTDTGGFFGPTIYGWRSFGDLGLVNGPTTRLPAFYAAKLMQWFARPGEAILNAASDYGLLTAYASQHTNGSVSVLLLNKMLTTNLSAQVSLNGFASSPGYTLRSYGILNDEATRTNGPAAQQDITTTNIVVVATNPVVTVPPYTMALLTFVPASPKLVLLSETSNQAVLQLQGQSNVKYVIQTSADLKTWSPVSTNTLSGPSQNLTNSVTAPGPQFWRAVWQP